MTAKTALILLFAILLISAGKQLDTRISGDYVAATVDNEGRIYAINSKLTMFKFSNVGDTIRTISVVNYGSDPIIDVSNPLEIFVYFRTTGWVIWLDNQLNVQSSLDLFGLNITRPAAFGRSNDGLLWVFDDMSKTLKKINRRGNIDLESIVLSKYKFSEKTMPILDDGRNIVFNDGQKNIYIFDRNLVLKKHTAANMAIVGLQSGAVYGKNERDLMSFNITADKNINPEKIWSAPKGTEILSKSTDYVLLSDSASLLLKTIPIKN